MVHRVGKYGCRGMLCLLSLMWAGANLACMRVQMKETALFMHIKGKAHPSPEASVEPVQLQAPGGILLNGFFLTHPQARASILYTGPNQGTAEGMLPFLKEYRDRQRVNVLMMNYRGYGFSTGKTSWDSLHADGREILSWLRQRSEAKDRPVLLHGWSLGSFAAAMLAASDPVDGVILQGSGTNATEWIRLQTPWYAKPFLRTTLEGRLQTMDSRDWVRKSRAPLLVLVGRRDESAHWTMSRALFEASPSEKKRLLVIPEGRHNDLHRFPAFHDAIDGFLKDTLAQGPA